MNPVAPQARALRPRQRAAFTLVEIMIVICILGVLLNIAAPAFVHARDEGQSRACIKNLKNLAGAKEEYALSNNISSSSSHTFVWADLSPYMRGGAAGSAPVCPTINSTYNYNALGVAPSCTYTFPVGSPNLVHAIP